MDAGQFLMLTLTFPAISALLFLVVWVEKWQFGGEQGGSASRPTAGDQASHTAWPQAPPEHGAASPDVTAATAVRTRR